MKSRCSARFFLFLSVTFLLLEQTATRCAGEGSPAPIDVGSRKQLFIDERFIAASSGVELVMNTPQRDGRVLLTTDQPWEQGRVIGVYSSVLKEDNTVKIWDAETGEMKQDLKGHSDCVNSVAISGDQRWLASGR